MNEEILRIQKMVAEGKITPEEGAELVESVGKGGAGRGSAANSPTAPQPSPGVAAVPAAKSSRKGLGIFAVVLFSLGLPLLALATGIAAISSHDSASGHFSYRGLIFLALPLVGGIILELLAIVLGFVAWRAKPGKVAAIGGLILVAVAVAAEALMIATYPGPAATAMLKVEPGYGGELSGRTEVVPADVLEQFVTAQVGILSSREALGEALDPAHAERVLNGLSPSERMGTDEELRARVQRIQAAKEKLLGKESPAARLQESLQVKKVERTLVIRVSLASRDPQFSADVVNSVVERYLLDYKKNRKMREDRQLAGLKQQRKELQPMLEQVDRDLAATSLTPLYAKAKALQAQHEKLQKEMELLDQAITTTTIKVQVSANSVSVMGWADVPGAK
jgi:hypothetical protein